MTDYPHLVWHQMSGSRKELKAQWRTLFKQYSFDIVQGHNLSLLSPYLFYLAHKRGIKTIWFAHDFWPLCGFKSFVNTTLDQANQCSGFGLSNCTACIGLPSYLRLGLFRRYMTHIDHAIAPGLAIQNRFKSYHFLTHRWAIIPPWIQLDHFPFAPTAIEKPRQLLYVGSLLRYKGLHTVLESFLSLKKANPSLKLSLISPDVVAQHPWVSDFLTHNQLLSDVFILGKQTSTQLHQHYQNNAVLLFPSICEETFGLTWAEAMSSGCPVIASDAGGIPEYASPYARIFKANDSSSLALTIQQELQNPLPKEHLRAASTYIQSSFTSTQALDKLLALYLQDLKGFG